LWHGAHCRLHIHPVARSAGRRSDPPSPGARRTVPALGATVAEKVRALRRRQSLGWSHSSTCTQRDRKQVGDCPLHAGDRPVLGTLAPAGSTSESLLADSTKNSPAIRPGL
jgi:hypothetical protein